MTATHCHRRPGLRPSPRVDSGQRMHARSASQARRPRTGSAVREKDERVCEAVVLSMASPNCGSGSSSRRHPSHCSTCQIPVLIRTLLSLMDCHLKEKGAFLLLSFWSFKGSISYGVWCLLPFPPVLFEVLPSCFCRFSKFYYQPVRPNWSCACDFLWDFGEKQRWLNPVSGCCFSAPFCFLGGISWQTLNVSDMYSFFEVVLVGSLTVDDFIY